MLPDPVNDVASLIGTAHDAARASLTSPKSKAADPKIQRRTSVVARSGDRLHDFVNQRGGKFLHQAETVSCGEIRPSAARASHAPPARDCLLSPASRQPRTALRRRRTKIWSVASGLDHRFLRGRTFQHFERRCPERQIPCACVGISPARPSFASYGRLRAPG